MSRLTERENKFIQMVYRYTGGDVSKTIPTENLYPLGERKGFNKREVTSITIMLKGLGLLETQTYEGVAGEPHLMIAWVRLTSDGAHYARDLQ